MILEFETNRTTVDDLDIGDKFWEKNDVDDYFYYCYLRITDKGEKVATMTLTLFDEIKIMNDHRDIIEIADSESEDLYLAIETYKNCKLNKEEREDIIWKTNHLCYIDTLYIYPGFRQQCIAKYLLSNLPQMRL